MDEIGNLKEYLCNKYTTIFGKAGVSRKVLNKKQIKILI